MAAGVELQQLWRLCDTSALRGVFVTVDELRRGMCAGDFAKLLPKLVAAGVVSSEHEPTGLDLEGDFRDRCEGDLQDRPVAE